VSDGGFVRYRTDVIVTDEGLEKALWEFKRRTGDVMQELKRRRRAGPRPGDKRRNDPGLKTFSCTMHSGEYVTASGKWGRIARSPPEDPDR